MSEPGSALLPEFENPPVIEVAIGVQFQPLFGLRPIELGALRDRWRPTHPVVAEQPLLPPAIETAGSGPARVSFVLAPAAQNQVWFLSADQSSLLQLQHDRLTVNWRRTGDGTEYPRYPAMRRLFEEKATDLSDFVRDRALGQVAVTQVEVTYVNSIESTQEGLGDFSQVLRDWQTPVAEYARPEQASLSLAFAIPDLGRPPVRLYVAANSAQPPVGPPALFLTLTVRGAPEGSELSHALSFMDQAHVHIVRNFALLTPESKHIQWRRTQ